MDDSDYWRSRIPARLLRKGIKVESFSMYKDLESSLNEGRHFAFVLGDFRMKGEERTGVEYLAELYSRYRDSLGVVFVFSVLSLPDLAERCAARGIDLQFQYLYKGTDFSVIVSRLNEECAKMHSSRQIEPKMGATES